MLVGQTRPRLQYRGKESPGSPTELAPFAQLSPGKFLPTKAAQRVGKRLWAAWAKSVTQARPYTQIIRDIIQQGPLSEEEIRSRVLRKDTPGKDKVEERRGGHSTPGSASVNRGSSFTS